MTCGIYSITSPSGNCYIGSSKNIENRKRQHFKALNEGTHHATTLQRAANKYGTSQLTLQIIEVCKADKLIPTEQQYFDTYAPKYNSTLNASSPLKDPRVRAKHLAAITTAAYRQAHRERSILTNAGARINNPDARAKSIAALRTPEVRMAAREIAVRTNRYLQLHTPESVAKLVAARKKPEYTTKTREAKRHKMIAVRRLGFETVYESTHAAAKATGATHANIGRSARTGIRAGGYVWVFATIDIVI